MISRRDSQDGQHSIQWCRIPLIKCHRIRPRLQLHRTPHNFARRRRMWLQLQVCVLVREVFGSPPAAGGGLSSTTALLGRVTLARALSGKGDSVIRLLSLKVKAINFYFGAWTALQHSPCNPYRKASGLVSNGQSHPPSPLPSPSDVPTSGISYRRRGF